jgi:hypothetical protein
MGIAILLVLCYMDIVTTNSIISKGGRELNPLMAYFMVHLGDWWWIPKAVMTLCVGWILYYIDKPIIMTIVILIQAVVVAWNLWQLKGGA